MKHDLTRIVRIAGPADEDDLVAMAADAYREVAPKDKDGEMVLRWCEESVRRQVRRALIPSNTHLPSFIGAIGDVNNLKASIFLACEVPWYADAIIMSERWMHVRPSHRSSQHAITLIKFAKGAAEAAKVPLLMGFISKDRSKAKSRLYGRYLTVVGGYYMHNVTNPSTGAR